MEEFNVYEGIMESLQDAIAYQRGDRSRCRVSVRQVPVPAYGADEVSRTRQTLNLSQRDLAQMLGVSPRTVGAWESGKNRPSGVACRLLYLLDTDPSLASRLSF